MLIYTKNKFGVELLSRGMQEHFPVKPIKPVSTIGAGDNFNAGLIYGMFKKGISKSELTKLDKETWQSLIGYGIRFAENVCLHYENYISDDLAERLLKK